MRTAAAYISKLKADVLGRTYKVQSTKNRLETNSIYRGKTECGPIDYTQIVYKENQKCGCISASFIPISTYHGGDCMASGSKISDGGSPFFSGSTILNAGSLLRPKISIFYGGSSSLAGSIMMNGGNPDSVGTKLMDGGSP